MYQTGERCTKAGTYHGRCSIGHAETASFEAGEEFPSCNVGGCGSGLGRSSGCPVTWTFLHDGAPKRR